MSNKVFQISIDGPSGAGKSTIARLVAERLGIDYIDTGAMYRALGLKVLKEGLDCEDHNVLQKMLDSTYIDFDQGHVTLDGENVSDKIRTPEVGKMASKVSALPMVREKLVQAQRDMVKNRSVVMDGRDIGNNVLPNADCKIFLTASLEERAKRRWMEMKEKGVEIDLNQVERDMAERDYNDCNRELNPLRKALDAVEVDATSLSILEVVDRVIGVCEEKGKSI
ncbi:MAG: (d)CMP kinase [Anaerovoracaceae bacterium]|jgi:cytidylate kinase